MDFKITLLNNASDDLDTVRSELELYWDVKDASDISEILKILALKRAIKPLSSTFELLAKYVLQAEHWALIFKNPGEASMEKLTSGDFKSVDYNECTTRLRNICGISLTFHNIEKIHKIRNKLEHYAIDTPLAEVQLAVKGAIEEVAYFCREKVFTITKNEDDKKQLDPLRNSLSELERIMDEI